MTDKQERWAVSDRIIKEAASDDFVLYDVVIGLLSKIMNHGTEEEKAEFVIPLNYIFDGDTVSTSQNIDLLWLMILCIAGIQNERFYNEED